MSDKHAVLEAQRSAGYEAHDLSQYSLIYDICSEVLREIPEADIEPHMNEIIRFANSEMKINTMLKVRSCDPSCL
ncbi:MAG: hypothetical protein AB3N14_14125 [Flavobacteriaceae bacterium]